MPTLGILTAGGDCPGLNAGETIVEVPLAEACAMVRSVPHELTDIAETFYS